MSDQTKIQHIYLEKSCKLEFHLVESSKSAAPCTNLEEVKQAIRQCDIFLGDQYFLIHLNAKVYIFLSDGRKFDRKTSEKISVNLNTSDRVVTITIPCLPMDVKNTKTDTAELFKLTKIIEKCFLKIDGKMENFSSLRSYDDDFSYKFQDKCIEFECNLDKSSADLKSNEDEDNFDRNRYKLKFVPHSTWPSKTGSSQQTHNLRGYILDHPEECLVNHLTVEWNPVECQENPIKVKSSHLENPNDAIAKNLECGHTLILLAISADAKTPNFVKDNILATLTFKDSEIQNQDISKETIDEFVQNEMVQNKKTLEGVKESIETTFQRPISATDDIFIERQYMKHLFECWQMEITETLDKLCQSKDSKPIRELLNLLSTIKSLTDIPKPFADLDFYKLFKRHDKLVSQPNDDELIRQFKQKTLHAVEEFSSTAEKELNFAKKFLNFLRGSTNLQKIIAELDLQNYSRGNCSFGDILRGVLKLDINTYGDNLKTLQEAATLLLGEENLFLDDKFKEIIASYIKPIEIKETVISNRFVIQVIGMNYFISEVLQDVESRLSKNAKIQEVRFISGDIIHVDRDLQKIYWHGRNIVVLTKILRIHKTIVWDVSGQDHENTYYGDAGIDNDGDGKQGKDGLPGESGGNVSILTEDLENPNQITIISNGGDGSTGQDGGDGKKGSDGNSLTKWQVENTYPSTVRTMYVKNNVSELVETVYNSIERNCPDIAHNWRVGGDYYFKGSAKDGSEAIFSHYMARFFTGYQCYFLYRGSNGKAGGNGGEFGLGGEGGYAGEIIVRNPYGGRDFNISKTIRSGKNGENGKGGYYGEPGKNGWDIGYLDHELWANVFYRGENQNVKIRLTMNDSNSSTRVWCGYYESYMEMDTYPIPINNKKYIYRVNTRQSMKRQNHALATRKTGISFDEIFNVYKEHVQSKQESLLQVLNTDLEVIMKRTLQEIADIQLQAEKETVQLKVERHASYNTPIEEAFEMITPSDGNFKFTSNMKDVITRIKNEPQLLDHWLQLKTTEVNHANMSKLFTGWAIIKRSLNTAEKYKEQIKVIEKLLIRKYSFATMHEIAKQLPAYEKVSDNTDPTAEEAVHYLVEDKEEDQKLIHPILGELHRYLYQNNKEQRQQFSKFCKEEFPNNHEVFQNSIRLYILEVGVSEKAPPNLKKILSEYREFAKEHEHKLSILFKAFEDELSRSRHAKLYELWKKANRDKTLKPTLERETKKDPFLNVLFKRCKRELERSYDWEKIYKDENLLKQYNEHIFKDGPLSAVHRELMADAFGINIRLYMKDEDNEMYLAYNHNSAAEKATHILLRNDQFVQLKINHEHVRLEMTRQIQDNMFDQILEEINSTKGKTDMDDYLIKRKFLAVKEVNILKNSERILDYEIGDISQILKYFTAQERYQLKPRLDKISTQYTDQKGILHSISKRLYSEGKHVSFQEFCFLINTILSSNIAGSRSQNHFSWIISTRSQQNWIDELLLLQFENYFKQELDEKPQWRAYLEKIDNIDVILLLSTKLNQSKSDEPTSMQCINEILYLLSNVPPKTVFDLEALELAAWTFALKEKYWAQQLVKLVDWQKGDQTLAVYYLLSMENIFGVKNVRKFVDILKEKSKELSVDMLTKHLSNFHNGEWILSENVLNSLRTRSMTKWAEEMQQKFSALKKDRDVEQLVEVISSNTNTSKGIIDHLDKLKASVTSIRQSNMIIAGKPVGTYNKDDIESWVKQFQVTFDKPKPEHVNEIFAVIDRTIELKNGWRLRDTQRLATLALLANENNTLAQVATGEGKSIIVVALGIIKALCGERVDVITSSSVLAKRDAEEAKDICSMFGISVSHNCSEDADQRKQAYSGGQIVYGDLSNFQRDYLLDKFYGKNILGDRRYENVIIDEVDSMLLDKGNNVLYLSHDLPGLDKLESLYIFIWQWLNRPITQPEDFDFVFDSKIIKEAILNDIYGLVSLEDIKCIDPELSEQQRNGIYERLIKAEIIDSHGKLIKENFSDIKFDAILSPEFSRYHERFRFYFKGLFGREKSILVPNYLKPFIELHLDSWIESAKNAFFMKAGQDYVVDVDRTGKNPDLNPNITILDRDTGTDQANSQWDEALHQFLQLKHGCRLAMQSLKAVFISNVTFFKLYRKLYGMTGTLGSDRERVLLQEIHIVDFVTMPTAKSKQFTEYKPIVCNSQQQWVKQIHESVQKLLETRSVLIICETVNDVSDIYKAFGGKDAKNVQTYSRDYEAFKLPQGLKELSKGHVIIATNLAGRGTDIKIEKELEKSGGLHVCLTYLPNNIRIEQQAYGRAARKGEKGSGQLIIKDTREAASGQVTIFDLRKNFSSKELSRLSETKNLYESQISVEEKYFNEFKEHYEKLKTILDSFGESNDIKEILLQSCLDKWAFWLDDRGKQLKNLKDECSKNDLNTQLKSFIAQLKLPTIKQDSQSWLHWVQGNPIQMIKLGKILSRNAGDDQRKAMKVFDNVIEQEPSHAEAAHYYKAYLIGKQMDWEEKPLNEKDFQRFKHQLRESEKCFDVHCENSVKAAAFVGNLKKTNRESIIRINAYEEQQQSLASVYNIFSRSIADILGHVVTPKDLQNHEVNEDLAERLYEEFQESKILSKPRVKSSISCELLKEICAGYGITCEILKEFLSKYQGKEFKEDEFEKALGKHIQLPGREAFWQSLISQGILGAEKSYVIVDIQKLDGAQKDLFQFINEKIERNELKKQSLEAKVDEIFLYAEMVEQQAKRLIFEQDNFEKVLTESKVKSLTKLKVISFNKKAHIEINKLATAQFTNHDVLNLKDFAKVDITETEAAKILTELIEQKTIEEQGSGNYKLMIDYDELEEVQLPAIPVYEQAVKSLLTNCFAFRLCLQRIERQVKENDPLRLRLVARPHQILVSELLEKRIIKPVMVQMPLNSSKDDVKKSVTSVVKKLKLEFEAATIDNIVNKLNGARAALETLEVPDVKLKALLEDMPQGTFTNKLEVHVFFLNALDLLLQLQEKKWTVKMLLNTALVTIIGLAQIAAGVALELLTCGLASQLGGALVGEGIGDILFAATSLSSGYFSWTSYKDHKLESILISIATAGIGAFVSKAVKLAKFSKIGHKLFGPSLQIAGKKAAETGAREILKIAGRSAVKETLKQISIRSFKAVTISLANQGFDLLLQTQIQKICQSVSGLVLNEYSKIKQSKDISRNLEQLYKTLGEASAKKQVDILSKTFFATKSLEQKILKISGIASKVAGSILKALNKAKIQNFVTFILKLFVQIREYGQYLLGTYEILQKARHFINDVNDKIANILKKNPKLTTGSVSADSNAVKFREKILDQWNILLTTEVGKLVKKYFVDALKRKIINMLETVAKKFMKKSYNAITDQIHSRRFDKLKKGYQKRLAEQQRNNRRQLSTEITQKYHKHLQKLLKKTSDPKLFVAIVRENIPMDLTCVSACTKVVQKLLQEHNLGGITIIVEGENGISQKFSSVDEGEEEQIVRLSLKNNQFVVAGSDDSETGNAYNPNSLYDALLKALPELGTSLTPTLFREKVTNIIATDKDIKEHIEKSWHVLPISLLNNDDAGGRPSRDAADYLQRLRDTFGRFGNSLREPFRRSDRENQSAATIRKAIVRFNQSPSKYVTEWLGLDDKFDRLNAKPLRKIGRIDFGRSLTTNDVDTVAFVSDDYRRIVNNKINDTSLSVADRSEFIAAKESLANMRIKEIFRETEQHYAIKGSDFLELTD